jgi:catechol 2,3-dioxygenase-like lactoylglutathione lyase family enzyme
MPLLANPLRAPNRVEPTSRGPHNAPVPGFVHHIDITVRDLARSTRFYDEVMPLFGFVRSLDVPEGPIWAGDTVEIGLVQASPASRPEHDRFSPGLHHLAFGAPDRASIDRTHAELLRLGAAVIDPPAEYPEYAAGYYAVFVADPDGIKLEYVHTPRWPTPLRPASAGGARGA